MVAGRRGARTKWSNECFPLVKWNSGFFHDPIFVAGSELDGLFGSLFDQYVSCFVRVNVLSTFEFDAV